MKKLILLSLGFIVVGGGLLQFNLVHLPWTNTSHSLWISGIEDDRVLVGASHYVFVAKIDKQLKTVNQSDQASPITEFAASIVHNVKGDLSGQIVLEQVGGYQYGVLYVEDSVPLLTVGNTYLLQARTDGEKIHITAYPGGMELISADSNASLEALAMLATQNQRVKELTAAYPNEILQDIDLQD